jgi:subtilisin family serine protease
VIVAAAGNDGRNDVHTPANCSHVVPVGSVAQNDGPSSFSNWGNGVPISAPGEMILSTGVNGDYTWMTGTSMATPHAAGVAALIWASSYGTENQTVVNRLLSTADRVAGTGSWWVHGRINAAAAVAGPTGEPLPSPSPSPSPSPTPSPTPAPSPTPTPAPPVACSPRPAVTVRTAKGGPQELRVTLTASATDGTTNRLREIRFGSSANAVIETGAQARAGNFSVTLPASSNEYTFVIRRVSSGGGVTVPLTAVDDCGEWNTFVGGGPNAF